ncbi:MAG: 4-hydroxybenzoate octaprenyltransferase [Acidobacteria bacterium]|nr:MAG: 4-hydroxybenzoate octaprenyltransferase [Acidobacteriota bacterium]
MRALVDRALVYGRMIRFSHSIFALPFALASAAVATGGRVPWRELPWIVVAMVGARSAAMGFNRLADADIDARNPRTALRELPSGRLSRREVWLFVLLSAAALVGASAMLNPLCLALSPLALLIVLGYSYTKRFTSLSHLVLGLALGIAPVGAWLAVRGRFDTAPVVLALAVLAWVAGFDTIYACQDVEFDRREGLRSLPARLGVPRALLVARVLHAAAVALLAALYVLVPLHPVYLAGVAAVAALLVYEHSLVSPGDLSRVDAAFFAVNGWISVGYLVFVIAALRLRA